MDEFEKQIQFELDYPKNIDKKDNVKIMKEALIKAIKLEALYSNASIRIVEASNAIN